MSGVIITIELLKNSYTNYLNLLTNQHIKMKHKSNI
ncbi:MAG: hypothetical protein RLZZ293_744 [Pseudomonadota bacterium]|jgi:hypothetical protein